MAPPITRARAKAADSGVVVTHSQIDQAMNETKLKEESSTLEPPSAITEPLASVLSNVEDSSAIFGRDARQLRDATVEAVSGVWKDAHHNSTQLAHTINENNATLLRGLNQSFGAVDERIRAIPTVASLTPEGLIARVSPFTGAGDSMQFSMWVRRLQDIMRMSTTEMSSERKANFLVAHLDGIAREKVDELADEDRKSYEAIVAHLRNCFEGPHQRHLARQALASCRQEHLEPSAVFANRLLNLVRAATAGLDIAAQKERGLEEFIARLRPDIRYFVKLDNPVSFEQAVNRAQTVKQLLAEATAERLINPVATSTISALNVPRQVRFERPPVSRNFSPNSRYNNNFRQRTPRRTDPRTFSNSRDVSTLCFNCGGTGHFARQCPSPPSSAGPKPSGTRNRGRYNVASNNSSSRTRNLSPGSSNSRRDSTYHDFEDARNKINTLSISLREKQEALEESDARVAAPLKRNDELSRSMFNGPPSARSPSAHHFIGVNSLMLCLVASALLPTGLSHPAWLCPQNPHDRLIHIPLAFDCSRLIPNISSPPQNLSIHLFRPNSRRYDTPAYLCKIIEQTASYSINLFGARFENHFETHKAVSIEHCRLMVQHHKCEHGTLAKVEGIFKTSNELFIQWPSAPFGCCVTHTVSVTNCIVVPTQIHIRHGAPFPDSAIGDLRLCKYNDGSCVLRDGSVLLWTPNNEQSCQFLSVSKIRGLRMGNIWLSESKELALSWDSDSARTTDCGHTLTLTDQGYAVAFIHRIPRSSPLAGIVTSNQLAAQLLAVEDVVQGSVAALFHHALSSLCDRTNLLAFSLHSALITDPSYAVRQLLRRDDVSATYHGDGLVQIHRCMPISRSHYKLAPFNETCFNKPKVMVTLPSGKQIWSFLDVNSFILTRSATPVACTSDLVFYLPFGNNPIKFNPISGSMDPIEGFEALGLEQVRKAAILTPPPALTIFHNLVLTNVSELVPEHQLTEIWQAHQYERLLTPIGSESHGHISESVSSAVQLQWSLLGLLPFTPFEAWVTVCCLYTTLSMIRAIIKLYMRLNFPNIMENFRVSVRPRTATSPPSTEFLASTAPSRAAPTSPHNIQFTRVELDAATSWPPKASVSPVVIGSMDLPQQYFVAQIPITVNAVRMLALIDTGAAITLTSSDMAPLLGTFRLQKSPIPCAIGVSGTPVKLLGYANGSIQIGTYSFCHPIHFTDTRSVPNSIQAYNIILGNDLLRRLPSWNIDYANRKLVIGGNHINIMVISPEGQTNPMSDLAVRVAQTTVLEPGTETFVLCKTACTHPVPLMLLAQRSALFERSLLVTPAVINSDKCHVLVANPTGRKEILYKDQAIALATLLVQYDDGILFCPSPSPSDIPMIDALSTEPLPELCHSPPFDLSRASVNDKEKEILIKLFEEYRDRFSFSAYDLGSYHHTKINIKTTTEIPPAKFRPPRIPVKFQKELDEHINRLLEAGRITESDTPWVHNTVLVKKKDGSLRVCLDFRPLNDITIPDRFPLPRIEDIVAKIAGNRFYTTLDLASGYMQLLLSPESQYKCGWATHRGIYQFVYLPFGLKNAGAYFCRVMARVLGGLEDNCLAYIDDVVIFNRTFQEHVQSLRNVFERFRVFNLKISHKKFTEIAQKEVTFLGHIISERSYSPAERNIDAIKHFPTPETVKQVKSFIGMANFFRRFIPRFAIIAAPLYELTREKSKFCWGTSQEEAFLELKRLLTSSPCLAFPQDKDFFLFTDGSQTGVGAALFQEKSADDKALAAVGYFSKTLSDSQRKWSTVHIELFAMVSALRFFKPIIYGNLTRVFSDHQPLTHLLKHNRTHDNLTRWVIELQSYNITIQYLKGSTNVVADCLSRSSNTKVRFQDGSREIEDIIDYPYCLHAAVPRTDDWSGTTPSETRPQAILPYDVLVEQKSDPLCSSLLAFIQTQKFPPEIDEPDKVRWLTIAERCIIGRNGCLYYRAPDRPTGRLIDRLLLPEKLREPVFLAFHTSPSAGGHFHWRKTLAKISRKYYWPHMTEHIFQLVTTCDKCQRKRNATANREPLIPVISGAIFDKVCIDLTGPLHVTSLGNKYILAMIDLFSKYVIATPLRDCTALSVAHAIMTECILKYGVMSQLVSDNAAYLKGELLTELGKMLRIERYYCTPYHHEGNGACERVFATFHSMLRAYINEDQRDWDNFVAACAFMYNTSVHTSTNETPFFMMFGRDPVFNIDLIIRHNLERHLPSDNDTSIYRESLLSSLHSAWQAAFQHNQKQRELYKRHYDSHHLSPLAIRTGERVYLRDMSPKVGLSQKLCNPWLGQFRVIEVNHPHLTIVSITSPHSTPKKVHMNQVKKCKELVGPVFTHPWQPQVEQEALTSARAIPLELIGYNYTTPLSAVPTPRPHAHQYNTRFRARCETL